MNRSPSLRQSSRLLLLFIFIGCAPVGWTPLDPALPLPRLQVSENGRFLQYEDGEPFFWLGDTSWLLFQKLSREEAPVYLQNRVGKGFNVIQVMVMHELPETNFYGDTAFIDQDPTRPNVTPGHLPQDAEAYDYWDHVDYIVELAAQKGLYLAMVPDWGSVVKSKAPDAAWAATYVSWLAKRYKDQPHLIWLNGGDIQGDLMPEI